jgi:hypothetical protein
MSDTRRMSNEDWEQLIANGVQRAQRTRLLALYVQLRQAYQELYDAQDHFAEVWEKIEAEMARYEPAAPQESKATPKKKAASRP